MERARFLFRLSSLLDSNETLIIQRIAHFLAAAATSGACLTTPSQLDALRRQILVSSAIEFLLITSSNCTFDAQLLLDVLSLLERMETTSGCVARL